jgi:hypothetical protein
VKHGFFAKQVIQSSKLFKEEWKEFRDLWQRLVEHYQPLGSAEEVLVEEIAVGFWRKRRALRCEMAEIDKARGQQIRAAARDRGYDYVLRTLTTAEEELSKEGHLSDYIKERLSEWYPSWDLLEGVTYDVISESGNLNVKRVKEIGERQEALLEKIRGEIPGVQQHVQDKEEEEK